jgi:hypothetical protein
VTLDARFLPPAGLVAQPEVHQALEAYQEAAASAAQAAQELARVERGRRAAEQADAEDLARALEAGRKEPAAQHINSYEASLASAKRRATATEIVRTRRWSALAAAFEEHSAEVATEAADQFAREREKFLGLVEQLTESHREVCAAFLLTVFAGANGSGPYRPTAVYPVVHSVPIYKDRLQDGDRILVSDILGLLADVGVVPPPAPTIKDEQVPEPVTLG